ncbi:hypothetical protein DFS34DRAFT_591178 [Phlyctochytrium arcticum]|nr:hypothetical protein DFS34DRAFT_591178 [Phlyctochytrium arcticum]
MSTRKSGRKRKSQAADISSSWYVGYAEDGESVEAIMAKFNELERMQEELAATDPSIACGSKDTPSVQVSGTAMASTGNTLSEDAELARVLAMQENPVNGSVSTFTQAQLEELFKRTSGFTVKQAALDVDIDDIDDLELWRLEMQGYDGAEWADEEDDNLYLATDDIWDDEFGPPRPTRRADRIPRVKSGDRRSRLDRASIIAKYKVMQIQMQDRNGNFFVMKKRVCTVDPLLPTYIRIPPVPVSRSWVKIIKPFATLTKRVEGCRYFETPVMEYNLKSLGDRFQVIHMDPPLLLPGESPTPNKISVADLGSLDIPSILPVGFLFIWVEKELIPQILKITQKWGFRYVENFAWIKRECNNRIAQQASQYFNKSKTTCLIFRKERKDGDVEMRHQRSPDCEFDFLKPKLPGQLTEEKPEFIYDVIETLLPQAVYRTGNTEGDRMLDLWGKPRKKRKGWTILVEPTEAHS